MHLLSTLLKHGSLIEDQRGASTVELAILAPVLLMICLFTIDVGFAVNEKMAIDHTVRVGADRAMSDPGESVVQVSLQQAASKNFSSVSTDPYPSPGTSPSVHVKASRFCVCPQDRATQVACTTTCAARKPVLAYYRLTGKKSYAGILVPSMIFDSALEVEVK